jgi:uncharacterized protein
MKKRTLLTMLGLGWAGRELFRRRWQIGSRLLGLPEPHYHVGRHTAVAIPMTDGINLIADHYFPRAQAEFPTLLMRTPYDRKQVTALFGRFFAGQGYHVVVQDTRGRFDSEGEFYPFRDEAADGEATIAWLVKQPWSNGVVGMFGQSYMGYVQWAAAGRKPPGLRAILPVITESRLAPAAQEGLALDNWLRWLLILSLDNKNLSAWERLRLSLDMGYQDRLVEPGHWHLPLGETDTAVRNRPIPFFRDWLAHPERADPFYKKIDHTGRVDGIEAEAHLIAGWHDFFLQSQLADYERLRTGGKRPYLTIGPWHHMDLRGMVIALRDGLAWFDSRLKQKHGRLRPNPVRVYVMGAEEWRDLDDWPPPATTTPYYLQTAGGLSGTLAAANTPPDQYRYNPADPTPGLGGPLMKTNGAGAVDQRPLLQRDDLLFYRSEPLPVPLTVMGAVRLRLFVASTREHTDFFGRLCDVYPDGRVLNICEGLLRLWPGREEIAVKADGTCQIEIDMWSTAYCFQPGHRLALMVTSAAFPRVARNLNTGEPLLTGQRLVTAAQTVYHDAQRPSALLLPVVGET